MEDKTEAAAIAAVSALQLCYLVKSLDEQFLHPRIAASAPQHSISKMMCTRPAASRGVWTILKHARSPTVPPWSVPGPMIDHYQPCLRNHSAEPAVPQCVFANTESQVHHKPWKIRRLVAFHKSSQERVGLLDQTPNDTLHT